MTALSSSVLPQKPSPRRLTPPLTAAGRRTSPVRLHAHFPLIAVQATGDGNKTPDRAVATGMGVRVCAVESRPATGAEGRQPRSARAAFGYRQEQQR